MVGSRELSESLPKSILKVIPFPGKNCLLAPFDDVNQALRLPVILLKEMAVVPTSLEFMNHESLDFTYNYCSRSYPFPEAKSHILVEIDGDDEDRVFRSQKK